MLINNGNTLISNIMLTFTSTNKAYKLRRVAPPGFATFCFRKAPAKRLIGSVVCNTGLSKDIRNKYGRDRKKNAKD